MRAFDRNTTGELEAALLDRLRRLRARADAAQRADEMLALVPRFPLKVQIQTATRCNAACTMCPYPEITREPAFEHGQMRESLYREILGQLRGRGVDRLSLFLMNEPLLDVRISRWIAAARDALPGTTLGLFSNGSALTTSLMARLARAGLDELCVSVHGFDRRTYESVMRGLSFERLQRNLRPVFEAYRAGAFGGLRLQIVSGDLPELAGTLEGADPTYRDHVLLKAFSNEREVVAVPQGLPSSRRAVSEGAPPLCQRPLVKLYVLADGSCVLCNVDWRRSVILGRVGEASIEEVWNGPLYRDVRRQHLLASFEGPILCRRCDYAQVIDHE